MDSPCGCWHGRALLRSRCHGHAVDDAPIGSSAMRGPPRLARHRHGPPQLLLGIRLGAALNVTHMDIVASAAYSTTIGLQVHCQTGDYRKETSWDSGHLVYAGVKLVTDLDGVQTDVVARPMSYSKVLPHMINPSSLHVAVTKTFLSGASAAVCSASSRRKHSLAVHGSTVQHC